MGAHGLTSGRRRLAAGGGPSLDESVGQAVALRGWWIWRRACSEWTQPPIPAGRPGGWAARLSAARDLSIMSKLSKVPILAGAALFCLSALLRFAAIDGLRRVYRLAVSSSSPSLLRPPEPELEPDTLWLQLDSAQSSYGSQAQVVMQARLNGRVIVQLAPQPLGDRLRLRLPPQARGLLEVRVAIVNRASCLSAVASDSRWLASERHVPTATYLAWSLSLIPLPTPLCA